MNAVILAGGMGTRLWPMSRAAKPKQFFEVVGDRPLVKETYDRLRRLLPAEHIFVSISPAFAPLLREYLPDIPESHVIIEPEKRDTGPAMGYASAFLANLAPDEPVVFVPSDHYIGDEELFLRCLSVGDALVRETGKLLDIGIRPLCPSTVLGYTKIGKKERTVDGIEVFKFAGHREKPPYEIAKAYIQDGSYLWHASYYLWTPEKFLRSFDTYAPEMGSALHELQRALREHPADREAVTVLYARLPKQSFDYLVTELFPAEDVLIMLGDFGWSDIGAWDTLYERLAGSSRSGNVIKGTCVSVETKGSLIYVPDGKMVAVIGMRDVIVVDTGDALLVCPRSEAQRVKEAVQKMKEEGGEAFL